MIAIKDQAWMLKDAQDKTEMIKWIDELRAASEQVYSELNTDSTASDLTVSMDMSMSSTSLDANIEEIVRIAALPENSTCADCGDASTS